MTRARARGGVTLVELLVGMAVFGILMAVASSVFISTQGVTQRQDRLASATGDARLALFRMGEIIRQAAYVYPPGVAMSVDGHSLTTGDAALALLVPAGTTYCPGATSTYCGFAYGLAPRADFTPPLPADGASAAPVLVEFRATDLAWPRDTIPARRADLRSWSSAVRGLLATGVDVGGTRLGSDVFVSHLAAVLDRDAGFHLNNVVDADSLLNGARVTLRLERDAARGPAGSVQSQDAYARAVPRSTLPNPD